MLDFSSCSSLYQHHGLFCHSLVSFEYYRASDRSLKLWTSSIINWDFLLIILTNIINTKVTPSPSLCPLRLNSWTDLEQIWQGSREAGGVYFFFQKTLHRTSTLKVLHILNTYDMLYIPKNYQINYQTKE